MASLLTQMLAFLQAPRLDSDLADGVRPCASRAHQARAEYLTSSRCRRRIAVALENSVEELARPVRAMTPQAPLSREAVWRCRGQLLELARTIRTVEDPRVRGVAIASQLAFDGRGPLFFQPATRDPVERLSNTLKAARAALRVSSRFDELEPAETLLAA